MLDSNGDGRITLKEVKEWLEKLGMLIPEKELAQMIDANGEGWLDVDQFRQLYQSLMDMEEEHDEDMREAFNIFDQNRDGFITVEELHSVLASLGLKQGTTLHHCKNMILQVDVDGDGMVNFNEFCQMMKGPIFS
ncbi:hypothetical protein VNO78_05418 [Psophocarpus tetragonolobus]|uniref:EF-hand domain-containing protein n=1 Tax=Psophocarpus tetragonolobus TaxID=3891 RepID=A0AAN9SQT3_PSOTE